MRFCRSTLKVKNMDESLKFYVDIIGLTLENRFKPNPQMEIAFLGNGETKIELIHWKDSSIANIGNDISWGFQVDSLDDSIEELLSKGIEICEGPYQPNPNTKFFYILDPNGLKIQVVELT